MAVNFLKLHDIALKDDKTCFTWLQHVGLVPKNRDCEICGKETTVTVRGANMVVFSYNQIRWHACNAISREGIFRSNRYTVVSDLMLYLGQNQSVRVVRSGGYLSPVRG
ncbi:hypothetical protein J6590_057637 [Homalodisca vitripennis]|nr:hypothetical protein J6590_057637 [Homalodisca vitripennis]